MFWLVVGLGAPAVLAISLAVFPEWIITLQGRLYRKYYHAIGLSTDEIDRGFQLPTDRLLMGKRSEFLQHVEEDPSQFRGLILIYRSIGILIGILLLCAIGLLWLGFATGTLAPLQTAQITELGVGLNIATAIVLLVAMDTCILAVCDQRTQKNQAIGFRCRLMLFVMGFALVLIPVGMVVAFQFPLIVLIGALATFAGLGHSKALEIKRRYLSGKTGRHL
jgi:hypothetical protein